MTLDEAIATIDIPQVEGLSTSYSQTGEHYVAIVPGGIKPEGKSSPFLCMSEGEAVKHWLSAFNDYAKGKTGILYWRERPILDTERLFQASDTNHEWPYTVYLIWSRLLISDNPVLPKDHPQVKRYYEDMEKRAA
jgi:hypothetical protein